MSVLGRGLASLIPKRNLEEAEEALEQIDSIEETEAVASPKTEPARPQKHVNVVEDFEELAPTPHDTPPLPEKPLVTPLTMDPETGVLRDATVAAAAVPAPKAQAKATVVIKPLSETAQQAHTPPARAVKPAAARKAKAPKAAPVEVPSDEKIDAALWDRHEGRVEHIAVADIVVNREQPRRSFDEEDMEELTRSIEQHGILQPLVVIRDGKHFELLAGERRLRAAKSLGWEKVPCVIKTNVTTNRNRLELALVENVQREDLNPVEEALGYKKLNEEFGMSHEEIGARVGKSRVNITNVLRILQLPQEIQEGLAEGKITPGHARAILMIPDSDKQVRFYHHMLDEGLTVRKAETRARRIQHQMKVTDPLRRKTRGRPHLALKYDHILEDRYGHTARVKFNESKNRYEVIFYAFNEAEAEELLGRLANTEQKVTYPEDEEE